ncbi:hypothetical protein H6758_02180 [Candidatus Nomurabacteria bacterium]|nr:hypothetical protein [Candidatus Nomurabacteria bacterium]
MHNTTEGQITQILEVVTGLSSNLSQFKIEVNQRFDGIDQRFNGIDQRLDGMDQRFDGMDQRLDGMDQRFDGIDGRLDGMDQRFDQVDNRLKDMLEIVNFLKDHAVHRDEYEINNHKVDWRLKRIERKLEII